MSYARKIGVLIVGVPLFIFGIILIPLPGPGLLVCFLALLLLAQEFEWARKHSDAAKAKLTKIYDKAKRRADKIEQKSNKTSDDTTKK